MGDAQLPQDAGQVEAHALAPGPLAPERDGRDHARALRLDHARIATLVACRERRSLGAEQRSIAHLQTR